MNSSFKTIKRILFIIPLMLLSNSAWLQDSTSHLYFDGVNDYAETHNTWLDYVNDDFTFEAIIKGDEEDQGTNPTIISNRWSHIKGAAFYLKNMGSDPRALCFSNRGEEWYIPNNGSLGTLLDGECHHVAIVRNDGNIYFYADGEQFGYIYDPTCANNLQGFNSIWIGRDHRYDYEFKGVIGNVRVWNVARTGEEIAANMYGGLDGTESNLRGCWELNEGEGQNVYENFSYGWSGFLGANDSEDGDGYDPDWFPGDYCADIEDYGDGEDDDWVDDEDEDEEDDTSGLSELNDALLKIHPNPVYDHNITVDFGTTLTNVEFTMVAISGQEVYHSKTSKITSVVVLNIGDLTKGIYLLKIQSDDQTLTKKIVVR